MQKAEHRRPADRGAGVVLPAVGLRRRRSAGVVPDKDELIMLASVCSKLTLAVVRACNMAVVGLAAFDRRAVPDERCER